MCKIVKAGWLLLGLLVSSSVWAEKSCEVLKEEIAANISGNGVSGYDLEILPIAEAELEIDAGDGAKIVGGCGGGTQKIVYWRDGKSSSAQPAVDDQSAAVLSGDMQVARPVSSPLGVLIAK